MRTWLSAGIGGVVVLAIAGAALYTLDFHPAPSAAALPAPPQTTTIERTDLSTSVTLDGTLGYGTATTFTGAKSGTVTWLPAVGTVVQRGQPLYDVDAAPVELFLGATPLYRTIDSAATPGPDIAEINANLRALGYYEAPTGDAYTTGTADALKAWQRRIGLNQTGTVAVGDVAMLPAPVRVGSIDVQPGAQAATALLGLTSTTKLVTADVDPTQVDTGTLTTGESVSLTLPSGAQTTGTISALSYSAGSQSGQSQDGSSDSSGDVGDQQGGQTLTVAIDDQSAVSAVNSGPVDVTVVTATDKGVLAVPVAALIVVQGGGFAVQVISGSTSELVGVQTGLFANGFVEISGQGIIAGLKVVTVS